MATPQWRIELHAHTNYSNDCLTTFEDLEALVRERSIDKIAITDHNTVDGALQLAQRFPLWVIPGIEVMTTKGELLGWYVTGEVPSGLTPEQTIDILRQQGALIGVSHPFDRHRQGAWSPQDLLAIVEQVDAIEVFNSRCLRNEDNEKALAFADEHAKLKTVGSDAHTKPEYGRSVLKVAPFANSADGLRRALEGADREETLSPFTVHFGSTFAKWAKRFVPSLRP